MSFHEESGSSAINPSASERQRHKATRRSCTGSASNPAAARSHSTSTRSIQARSPSFGLGLADLVPADVIPEILVPEIFGFAGFRVGLAPTVAPVSDGNHCHLFRPILLECLEGRDWRALKK